MEHPVLTTVFPEFRLPVGVFEECPQRQFKRIAGFERTVFKTPLKNWIYAMMFN